MIRETKFGNVFNFSIVDILKFTGPLNAFLLLFVLIFWIASFYEQSTFTSKVYQYKDNFDKYFEGETADLNENYDMNFFTPEEDLYEGNNVNDKVKVNINTDNDKQLVLSSQYNSFFDYGLKDIKNAVVKTIDSALSIVPFYNSVSIEETDRGKILSKNKRLIKYNYIIQPEISCNISREDAIQFIKERGFDENGWNQFRNKKKVDALNESYMGDIFDFQKYKQCVSTILITHFQKRKFSNFGERFFHYYYNFADDSNVAYACNNELDENTCFWGEFSVNAVNI